MPTLKNIHGAGAGQLEVGPFGCITSRVKAADECEAETANRLLSIEQSGFYVSHDAQSFLKCHMATTKTF